MMRGQRPQDQVYAADPLAGQPTDEHGIPVSVLHSPQTELPVWQYIHRLTSPLPNPRNAARPFTHICVLCSAVPQLRPTGKGNDTWRRALMRQRMSTNAVAHMQRVHPVEFEAIAEFKKVKREALAEKALNGEAQPKKKRAKKTPGPKTKTTARRVESTEVKTGEVETVTTVAVPKTTGFTTAARKRNAAKTADLVKNWLLSSGLPASALQTEALQHLLKLSLSGVSALPTVSSLNAQVQEEFAKFGGFLGSYLAAESQAAMGLPFATLRHEFRAITGATADDAARNDVVVNQDKAFLGVTIAFIDSKWQRVELVLAAQEVARGWEHQVDQLVAQTISETYGVHSLSSYVRFRVDSTGAAPSTLAAGGDYDPSTDEQEDQLTHTLRGCVTDALGVGPSSSFGGESSIRRVLRLLQELVSFFEPPDRANSLLEVGAAHGVQVSFCSASSIDKLAHSTATSIGAMAELVRVSCLRFRAYWLYFESPARPTASELELESAWTQLTAEDWSTAVELEAMLHHLTQFRLEERIRPRSGVVAASYALLFRRLLSVTANASSLKCLSLEDESVVGSSPGKRAVRRKPKRVDTFSTAGRQCVIRLRQLIAQRFASPSTPAAVDDEIKAMLLDPRISSKAANLVTDSRAFRRAHDALRQEHRVVFELLAGQQTDANSSTEDEEELDEDDDEMSALLMVDGPKNQPPAPASTSSSGRHSSEAIAEDEARAWREWQQVYVAWDTLANEGADLYDKGQYNLLKLYHHVDILQWFRDVGQQAHPVASLLARLYLGQQSSQSQSQSLGSSLLRFAKQEPADWVLGAARRAEKRCILHHNWNQYQKLRASTALPALSDESVNFSSV